MDFLILIIAAIYLFVKYSGEQGTDKKKTKRENTGEWSKKLDEFGRDMVSSAEESVRRVSRSLDSRTFDMTGGKKSTGRKIEREQARRNADERRRSERRWAEARAKQSDSAHIHAASVDSCEGRLESLKILYDAGILDREEYTQRVARIKSLHSHR